ncbi:MAG: ParB/RepB/Spo0J family partition protein [Desulfurivibrionaceae bacterium]|nr:ParB/RepB/Spo0J family partition protein [Desulfobulbales bacterium]MDT8335924.1 ParB/RepB/Spo0J family partition protein [Desulfurivibrionaceae bacterium]
MAKSRTLGKGLDALLPSADFNLSGGTSSSGILLMCPVNDIVPNPYQPRKKLEKAGLRDLADSIGEKGILQPLVVRKKEDESGYELIAGERRLQAGKMAGLKEVPVLVIVADRVNRLELAIIENIQRQNLNALEEADAYNRLIKEFGHTQEEVAKKVGRDRSTVANTLRLLHLPDYAQNDLLKGTLSMGHVRVLLSAPDRDSMKVLRDEMVSKNMSVRQAEQLVKKMKDQLAGGGGETSRRASPKKKRQEIPDSYCQTLTGDIARHLDTKAAIVQNGARGKLEIEYYSLDDLERLVSLITKAPPVA